MKFCTDVDHTKIWNLRKKICQKSYIDSDESIVCADRCHFLGYLFLISFSFCPHVLVFLTQIRLFIKNLDVRLTCQPSFCHHSCRKWAKIKNLFFRNFDNSYQSRAFKMVFLGLLRQKNQLSLNFGSLTHHTEHE